jgi:hypothetical protein
MELIGGMLKAPNLSLLKFIQLHHQAATSGEKLKGGGETSELKRIMR